MAIAWLAPNTQSIMAGFEPALMSGGKSAPTRWQARFSAGWAVASGLVLFLGLYFIRDGQPFIYFQF